ncbi:hypothetical protein O6H91_13G103600 [Diphasiastrum complanatum]|uniref:Uncharacterized protein n=1 Tax=Diphasiastrum complanatum TaxID=34168 RepID=A0ACC2BXY5_DIPCM|nr:hypothetical protein O6H91_13G103600 [Diphasiastrum complanatum]
MLGKVKEAAVKMMLSYRKSSGVYVGLGCSIVLSIFVVEMFMHFGDLHAASQSDALPSIVRDPEGFTHVGVALQKWDAHTGCARFRAKHEADLQRNRSRPQALQDAEAFSCEDLRLSHVSVLVRGWTWIPDALDNLYSCKCGLTCLWTKSPVLADNPEAALYETTRPPLYRRKGEPLRVYLDLEPGRNPSSAQDIFVTYHADDDLQATYAGNSFHNVRSHFISPIKDKEILVYWSSSRCVTERQQIASRFLSNIPHHSFGKCLNNVGGLQRELEMYPKCELPVKKDNAHWSHALHCSMSHYKFVLAIENTRTESYVTEKLFYALDAGSVPIYFGASNVWDFVPPHSIIEGYKFSSLESLASYVKEVASDPLLYAEYHAWRHCGVMGNYYWARAVSLDSLPCRLCSHISKIGGNNF